MAEDAAYFEKALDPQKGWMKKNEVREKQGLVSLDEFEQNETDGFIEKMSTIRKSVDLAFNGLSRDKDL